jgi:hypothetical protein
MSEYFMDQIRVGTMLDRRQLLLRWAHGFGGMALASLAGCQRSTETPVSLAHAIAPVVSAARRAKRVIFLYMDGGPSQMDTFDPKPRLDREDGQPIKMQTPATQFNIGNRVLKSPFKFAKYGQSGLEVSEIFPHMAQCADELCVIRSMVADHSEHTAANFFLHTGSALQGKPSVGSWVAYGLGEETQDLPAYIVLDSGLIPFGGTDNFGNGFLPAKYQGTLFRQGPWPIADVQPREPGVELQRAKLSLLERLSRRQQEQQGGNSELDAVVQNYELAFRMQTAVPELLDLKGETQATRDLYGLDQPETSAFGTQCLLARRLVERGVRFVQLLPPKLPEHNRWDQHSFLADHHRSNALAVDRPIAGLLRDLRSRGLLDETLVVWGGEFGRTPMSQDMPMGKHGRDHNPFGFTMWLAGGGVRPGMVYGATDEYGYFAVENPVHIHDLHATMLHLLGLDHEQLTFRYGGRDFRLTDVFGNVVHDLLA